MVAPGMPPPDGEVSDFSVSTSSVKTAALAVNIFAVACTTLLFAMRMAARHLVSGMYALDDICSIIAWLGFTGYCTIYFIMISHGGGIHQWDVPETEVTSFFKRNHDLVSDDAHIDQSVYATQIVYCPAVFATKASILFFLTRVFAPFERYCRFIYLFIMLMGIYYTLILVLKIFICRPIHLFWNPSGEGQCFDQRSLILADNIISLITDIAVLIIPCPLAGGLKVAMSAKLRIAAVFGVGGLACVCSFIRLIDIIKLGSSPDATYSFTLINLFGIAEVGIGLVCACFPVMPAFWKYLRKRHPSQMTGGSYPTGGRSHPGGRSTHRSASGIELTGKKSHLSSTTRSYHDQPRHGSVSMAGGKHMFDDNGSDENMLIPHEGQITVSVRGGEDLELGKAESTGDQQSGGEVGVGGGGGGVQGDYGTKRSYEDQGIVRTVEVQMMREPK